MTMMITELPAGFTTIERVPGGLALDYIRGNLFAADKMVPLPHDVSEQGRTIVF